ncbi:hypothetical protein EI94DRAFT_1698052 [Lactarius quietus]|nr:hypothetical protein EI94DRAFT_1698052 [Lactarius quietus]
MEYVNKIVAVPHARMSHFHTEVKEGCSALMLLILTAMVSPTVIAAFITDQLSNYNYTFLKVPKGIGHGNLVMRSKPYRNEHLIQIIREEYFTSPSTGKITLKMMATTVYKVPIPIVALVATAMLLCLYKWHTGNEQQAEFSANTI